MTMLSMTGFGKAEAVFDGRFILSADAHAADALDCAFDRFAECEDFCAPEFARQTP